MIKTVNKIVKKNFDADVTEISPLGGGFYGRVFHVKLTTEPYHIVIKVYLYEGLAKKEKMQIEILSQHSTIPMPEIYFLHKKDADIPFDIIGMQFFDGVNAGEVDKVNPLFLDKIANNMVDNLIAYHQTINPLGFGEIDSSSYEKDWRLFYKNKVNTIYRKATAMFQNKKIDNTVMSIITSAYENFDHIFYLPITKARLLHGDYNTWNILLNHDRTNTLSVIDPFNCCWGDSEMDLYQLNNANGKYYRLLDRYKAKVQVSENFELKKSFYQLFNEVMHFHDANVDVAKSNIPLEALELKKQMKAFHII